MVEKISWNTTRLGAVGALGVLAFIVNFATGMLIILATGIPAGGAWIMLFIDALMVALTILLIRAFGSATIMGAVWGILALSVPILGPPGFLPKIIILALLGLAGDTTFLVFRKREKIAAVLAGLVAPLVALGFVVLVFSLFLPPAAAAFKGLLPYLLPLAFVEGPLGGWVGWKIFDSVRDRAIVVRLRGE